MKKFKVFSPEAEGKFLFLLFPLSITWTTLHVPCFICSFYPRDKASFVWFVLFWWSSPQEWKSGKREAERSRKQKGKQYKLNKHQPFSGRTDSFLQSRHRLFFFFWPCHTPCWILVPHQGSNYRPLHWQPRVLTTGPPGKSHNCS